MEAAAEIWMAHPQSTEAIQATLVIVFVSKMRAVKCGPKGDRSCLTSYNPTQQCAPPWRRVSICPIIQPPRSRHRRSEVCHGKCDECEEEGTYPPLKTKLLDNVLLLVRLNLPPTQGQLHRQKVGQRSKRS